MNYRTLTPDIAQQLELPDNARGAVVLRMSRNSAAYEAGIRPGDVIVSFNGQKVETAEEFTQAAGRREGRQHRDGRVDPPAAQGHGEGADRGAERARPVIGVRTAWAAWVVAGAMVGAVPHAEAGQAEAAKPAANAAPGRGALDATPLHYQLAVTPDFGTAAFDGDLTIDVRVDKPTARLTLDAVDLDVYDAEILLPDGRRLRPSIASDPAAGTVSFTTATRLYLGTRQAAPALRREAARRWPRLLPGALPRPQVPVSQMEATDARRAFPCVDEPAFKASFALSAVVRRRLTAISNGKLLSDTPAERFGRHVLRFGTTPRMSTYLVALAVGEFGCLERTAECDPDPGVRGPRETRSRGGFALEAARAGVPVPRRGTSRSSTRSASSTSWPCRGFPARWRTAGRSSSTKACWSIRRGTRNRARPLRRGHLARGRPPVAGRRRDHAMVGRPVAERRAGHVAGAEVAGGVEAAWNLELADARATAPRWRSMRCAPPGRSVRR